MGRLQCAACRLSACWPRVLPGARAARARARARAWDRDGIYYLVVSIIDVNVC
eukprot:COSAG02_NODE_32494_length_515_cov_0.867788_1_plen_52_part_10